MGEGEKPYIRIRAIFESNRQRGCDTGQRREDRRTPMSEDL